MRIIILIVLAYVFMVALSFISEMTSRREAVFSASNAKKIFLKNLLYLNAIVALAFLYYLFFGPPF